ncbi:MAG: hypothetical protein AAF468_17025 [Pseudomonadota bacterium]
MTDGILTNLVFNVFLAGGVLGALGQCVRTTVGLKKLRDQSAGSTAQFNSNFSASRLFTSVFIGFIAGALTAFFMAEPDLSIENLSKQTLIGFMAAGYAGADVIEGFASRIRPGTRPA